MSKVRVAIVQLPRLLEEVLVAMLARASDIEIVNDEVAQPGDAVDVLIMGLDQAKEVRVHELLLARPSMRVLGVAANGRRITFYELRPHRTPLGELSADGLVSLVRRSGQEHVIERWSEDVGETT